MRNELVPDPEQNDKWPVGPPLTHPANTYSEEAPQRLCIGARGFAFHWPDTGQLQ